MFNHLPPRRVMISGSRTGRSGVQQRRNGKQTVDEGSIGQIRSVGRSWPVNNPAYMATHVPEQGSGKRSESQSRLLKKKMGMIA